MMPLSSQASRVCDTIKISRLPLEMVFNIFRLISPYHLRVLRCVCWEWKCLGEHKSFEVALQNSYGKAIWERHYGEVGEEPLFSKKMWRMIDRECAAQVDPKITVCVFSRLFILIPQMVAESSYTLDLLERLLESPLKGTPRSLVITEIARARVWRDRGSSYWVTVPRELIPESLHKSPSNIPNFLTHYSQTMGCKHDCPTLLEGITILVLRNLNGGSACTISHSIYCKETVPLGPYQVRASCYYNSLKNSVLVIGDARYRSGVLPIYRS